MGKTIRLTNDWQFFLNDSFHDCNFEEKEALTEYVSLPHDWSIHEPFSEKWASATGYLPGGIGWYRKEFTLPQHRTAGKVYLHFDGVYCNSSVWINGTHLGDRPNGFVPFRYDISSYLNDDMSNMVVVRCDHSKYGDSRWYTGSGINRNVYLLVHDNIHLKAWGVFAVTESVSDDVATLDIRATVQNHLRESARVEVVFALYDDEMRVVAESSVNAVISAHGETEVQANLMVKDPQLWSDQSPYLYSLQTSVCCAEQVTDTHETPVGIRTISFDAQDGFKLNGHSLKLKGVCLHDDAGALGTAVPTAVWTRRLKTLKECGVNAIRMAHNPHMPELYDLCDKMGFLVQDEAFDEWELGKNKWIAGWNVGQAGKDGYSEHFKQWAENDLRDMILSSRNHPSIIMWSIGNEVDYPNDPYTHEILDHGASPQSFMNGHRQDHPNASRLGDIANWLVSIAKTYDHSRPVTAALASALISNEVGYADALDIVGYNYQEFRYEADHAQFPNRILYGSENGMLWSFWDAVQKNPYILGQFLWTGIDYLGEAHGWPLRSNEAGLMDLAGFPKPEYYFRQSLWTDEPMVYIGTCESADFEQKRGLWDHQKADPIWAGCSEELIRVTAFTNCDSVELLLNGISIGTKLIEPGTEPVLHWDVGYHPGTLTALASRNGVVVAQSELSTAGAPARLHVESDRSSLTVDPEVVAHIEVNIVDQDGVRVRDNDQAITWNIEGPARLLGIENANPSSHEDYVAPFHRTYRGRQLGYIQATGLGSLIKITLSARGLEDALVFIQASSP